MLEINRLIRNIYLEEQRESSLSWFNYIKTLNEDKQIECLMTCEQYFQVSDWENIVNLPTYILLCEQKPRFNVYKTFVLEITALNAELYKYTSDVNICMQNINVLNEKINNLEMNINKCVIPPINNNFVNLSNNTNIMTEIIPMV